MDRGFVKIDAGTFLTGSQMAVASLFSGIGGFELGFKEAGLEPNLFCDSDPAARTVLRSQFPGVPIYDDVADVESLPPDTTVLTAGFPCQNLSMAGDKAGISGSKSSVVRRMFDLIERSSVPTVVIENVYFMLQLDRGSGMHSLASQFENLGYRWAFRVVDTMAFGLPQRRRRVYLVASTDIDPRSVLFADRGATAPVVERDLTRPLGFYWTEGRSGIGTTVDAIPPLKVASGLGIPSTPAVLFPDGEVLVPSLDGCERLQGFPPGWTSAADESSNRSPRWRLVGNAVSVPVARWLASRIKSPGTVLRFDERPLEHGARWPDAGWNVGAGRKAVAAGDRPIQAVTPSISDFRASDWQRLSARALDGFIGRVEKGGLRTPVGFVDMLRAAERRPPLARRAAG